MKVFMILILISFLNTSFADEQMSGKITSVNGEELLLSEGDIFNAKMVLWPFTDYFFKSVKDLEYQAFGNFIKILDIKKIKPSINNSEVLEVYARFALLNYYPINNFDAELAGKKISFKIDKIKLGRTEGRVKEPIIVEQPMDMEENPVFIGVTSLTLLIIVICSLSFYIRKKRRERLAQQKKNEREDFIRRINVALTRIDFENIYRDKNNWKKYIAETKTYENYITEMNKLQYKKDLTGEELLKIKKLNKELLNHMWEENVL